MPRIQPPQVNVGQVVFYRSRAQRSLIVPSIVLARGTGTTAPLTLLRLMPLGRVLVTPNIPFGEYGASTNSTGVFWNTTGSGRTPELGTPVAIRYPDSPSANPNTGVPTYAGRIVQAPTTTLGVAGVVQWVPKVSGRTITAPPEFKRRGTDPTVGNYTMNVGNGPGSMVWYVNPFTQLRRPAIVISLQQPLEPDVSSAYLLVLFAAGPRVVGPLQPGTPDWTAPHFER